MGKGKKNKKVKKVERGRKNKKLKKVEGVKMKKKLIIQKLLSIMIKTKKKKFRLNQKKHKKYQIIILKILI